MSIVALDTTRIAGRMTEAEYDRERVQIARTKAAAKEQAGVRWEQELAALFYRSGWTTEQLAAKEGKHVALIRRQLKFGEFLSFVAGETRFSQSKNEAFALTEGLFHRYWLRTGTGKRDRAFGLNDRERFRQIAKMLVDDPEVRRPLGRPSINTKGLVPKVIEHGRKWRSPKEIAEQLAVSEREAEAVIHNIKTNRKHEATVETKKVGTEIKYRIFEKEKTVSVDELIEKLTPIIKALDAEGRKSVVTTIPHEVRCLAARLKKLLDEWAE